MAGECSDKVDNDTLVSIISSDGFKLDPSIQIYSEPEELILSWILDFKFSSFVDICES